MKFKRERPGDGMDRPFGRAVIAQTRRTGKPDNRPGRDDARPLSHVRYGPARQAEVCVNIDLQCRVEFVLAEILNIFPVLPGDILHKRIDMSVLLDCLVDQPIADIRLGQIASDNQASAAKAVDCILNRLCILKFFWEARNRDIGTFAGKVIRDGATDARVSPCDQGGMVAEFVRRPISFAFPLRERIEF